MRDISQAVKSASEFQFTGYLAFAAGVVSAVGLVFFIAMFYFMATGRNELVTRVGMINDICVAIQYLLTIPLALALNRILSPYNPVLMRFATIFGVAALLAVIGLQLLLIFNVLTFEQQMPWIALAMILGVGTWLLITGLVARSTNRMPNSLLMSILAIPYIGYPVWAVWLGLQLLAW